MHLHDCVATGLRNVSNRYAVEENNKTSPHFTTLPEIMDKHVGWRESRKTNKIDIMRGVTIFKVVNGTVVQGREKREKMSHL